MTYPKVKFKNLHVEENLNSLVWYLNPVNSKNSPLDFYKFTLKLFKELNGKILDNRSEEEIYMILDKEVRPILEKLNATSNDSSRFQKI